MKVKSMMLTLLYAAIKIAIWMAVIFFVYSSGVKAYNFGVAIYDEEAVAKEPGKNISVQINEEESDLDIGKLLKEKGLIKDPYLFYVQLKISPYSDKLQTGRFTLNTSMTSQEIISVLAGEDSEEEEETEE